MYTTTEQQDAQTACTTCTLRSYTITGTHLLLRYRTFITMHIYSQQRLYLNLSAALLLDVNSPLYCFVSTFNSLNYINVNVFPQASEIAVTNY